MSSWTSSATFHGDPERVIQLLTDPEAAREWAPVDFTVDDLRGSRLHTGDVAHVAGRVAGRRLSFDVEVLNASKGKLVVHAVGPVDIDVEYGIHPEKDGSEELRVWIDVSSAGGLIGRLVASATDAAFAAGALERVVQRIVVVADARAG
jgi:hypothetical protein